MNIKYNNKLYQTDSKIDIKSNSITLNNSLTSHTFTKLSDNHFRIFKNSTYHDVFICEDKKHFYVSVDGKQIYFDKVEEETFGDNNSESNQSKQTVKPPMPGSIVKVLVEEGQQVEEGVGLIIVSAMKMETTLYSTIAGMVKDINAIAGEQVDTDKILMVIEKEEQK